MRSLALVAVCLPFGGPRPTAVPAPDWAEVRVAGLTLLVGKADTTVGLGGLSSDAPVKVAGGTGSLHVRQGWTRDVEVRVADADVREVTKLFSIPDWLKGKLTGRIGSVVLTIHGDALSLTATKFHGAAGELVSRIEATGDLKAKTVKARMFCLGGLVEYAGRIPGE